MTSTLPDLSKQRTNAELIELLPASVSSNYIWLLAFIANMDACEPVGD